MPKFLDCKEIQKKIQKKSKKICVDAKNNNIFCVYVNVLLLVHHIL